MEYLNLANKMINECKNKKQKNRFLVVETVLRNF